jgi:hypothetical protein
MVHRLSCGMVFSGILASVVFAPPAVRADDDAEVKTVFTSFQTAVKKADQMTLWTLLAAKSQAEADAHAKTVQASYGKAGDDEKVVLEKSFGLGSDEMSKLSGKLFLKSKPFLKKYREVAGATIDKLAINGDMAKVHYTEEDSDKETLDLVRENGKWKLAIKVK